MPLISFQPYAKGLSTDNRSTVGSIDPRLSRTNYFDGQLLKASDLTRDQIYLDERLLELGQVLGSGIAQGLEIELVKNYHLQVQPGIAVAPSGRVLQLSDKTLEINLQDSGFIADLNKGKYRRFRRGLYAVVLHYAEIVDGVAETYPANLASRTKMQASSFAEGVELALIPLDIDLPRGDEIAIRAALAQPLIVGGYTLPTDEAVALGLIAMDQAKPLWLDRGLVRRPLQSATASNRVQQLLASHYQELFDDLLAARREAGRQNDFAANQFFHLLPPHGRLPKEAIDPVNGAQRFFPKEYDVAIAPVRRADLPSLLHESSHLAAMDLKRDADADIMVLVPLSDTDFALYARQLEKTTQPRALPAFSGLALRLFAQPPTHPIDTDADAWKAIWNKADPSELVYVRRPPRTAETNVSGIVLARGFSLPPLAQQSQLVTLQTQLTNAQNQNTALKTQYTTLQNQYATLQTQATNLQTQNTTLQTQATNLQNQNTTLQNQNSTLQSQNANLQNQYSTLQTQNTNLQNQYTALQTQASTLQTQNTSYQNQIAVLTTQLNTANSQLTTANTQLSRARAAISMDTFAKMRRYPNTALAMELEKMIGTYDDGRAAIAHLFAMVAQNFDNALWPSLLSVARNPKNLLAWREGLIAALARNIPVARTCVDMGTGLGMSPADIEAWKKLAA